MAQKKETVRIDNVLIISLQKCNHDERSAIVKKNMNSCVNLNDERSLVRSSVNHGFESMPGSPTGMRERDLRSSLVAALLATLLIL